MKNKIIKKLLNITFLVLGILIVFWTVLWLIELKTATDLGTLIIGIIFLSIGIYATLIFLVLIFIYIILSLIIKKIKKIKKSK
ncbi:hypothetical protein GW932_04205 [archaeon]|nr:hypothetical protein [archaeon]